MLYEAPFLCTCYWLIRIDSGNQFIIKKYAKVFWKIPPSKEYLMLQNAYTSLINGHIGLHLSIYNMEKHFEVKKD